MATGEARLCGQPFGHALEDVLEIGERLDVVLQRLVDAEIDNATAAGPLPQYYLGLAAEVLLAAGRPTDVVSLISTVLSPPPTTPVSGFICRKSIACAACVCWRSAAATRMRRDWLRRPLATLPNAKAPSSSNVAPKCRFHRLQMLRLD